MRPQTTAVGFGAALLAAVAAVGLALSGCDSGSANGQPKAPDVLIIQASGTPVTEKVTPKNVDAVSCPTPATVNCKTLAAQAAAALRDKGFSAKAVAAGDVKSRDEILGARLVVLASPSYFGGVSWKMHKLFDEKFFEIHALGGDRLAKKPFASLIMGKSEEKCAKSVASLEGVVTACNGTPGPSTIVLTADSKEQVRGKIAKFAEEIAGQLK